MKQPAIFISFHTHSLSLCLSSIFFKVRIIYTQFMFWSNNNNGIAGLISSCLLSHIR